MCNCDQWMTLNQAISFLPVLKREAEARSASQKREIPLPGISQEPGEGGGLWRQPPASLLVEL